MLTQEVKVVVLSPAAALALDAVTSRTGVSESQAVEALLIQASSRQLAWYIREHAMPINTADVLSGAGQRSDGTAQVL